MPAKKAAGSVLRICAASSWASATDMGSVMQYRPFTSTFICSFISRKLKLERM